MAELTSVVRSAYQQLADMGFSFWGTRQSEDDTRHRCGQGTCLVAEEGGRLVGTAVVKKPTDADDPEWYRSDGVMVVNQFAVIPELQGQGVGGKLATACERIAFAEGAAEVAIDTAEGATHLIDFYAKRGYRQVGKVDWDGTNYVSVLMSKRLRPTLETERLVLRELGEEDRAIVQAYWADERFLSFYPPDRLSPRHCDETVDESLAALAEYPRRGHYWAVTVQGNTIGRIRLELSKRNSTGDIGYELHPDHWGNGYATEVLKEVVRFSFEELKLHRLCAWAYEPNKASQRVLEKAGFTHEGTMRKRCSWGDDWVDDLMFGLLVDEWAG